ncbi:AAA family ATPase [Luteimicrobium sp. NPDC057192]|uniref:AAA family ATPase n=1 Tax=Luteimicrobium sp. NPDC057192 TaxID=3346042 RepID=UPI0036367D04
MPDGRTLGARDDVVAAVGHVPARIAVAGVSGSGKTTLGRRVADRLGLPHTEIDALFHGPGWTPRETFLDDVRAVLAQPAWVTEWQYREAKPLILERVELLVWLDLPTPVAMQQVIRRTLRRRLGRQGLWNGNQEPPLRTFFTDDEHIVRWAWSTRNTLRSLDERLAREAPHVVVVRLRTRGQVEDWFQRLPRAV